MKDTGIWQQREVREHEDKAFGNRALNGNLNHANWGCGRLNQSSKLTIRFNNLLFRWLLEALRLQLLWKASTDVHSGENVGRKRIPWRLPSWVSCTKSWVVERNSTTTEGEVNVAGNEAISHTNKQWYYAFKQMTMHWWTWFLMIKKFELYGDEWEKSKNCNHYRGLQLLD
jgi:hypothetical protein